jgi:hypothetical protein
MELGKEFIEQHGLNEDQVKAIATFGTEYTATIKKEYDGVANQQVDGIMGGVAKSMGVDTPREQGEKWNDWLSRVSTSKFSAKEQELQSQIAAYEEKIKSTKGSELITEELNTTRQKLSDAQKQLAELEPLAGYKEKYEELYTKSTSMELNVAFGGVKPSFSQDVNEYEAKAKWDSFKKETLDKFNIVFDGNEPIAVDKENEHRRFKLSELVAGNEEIQALAKGRVQGGTGGNPTPDYISVEDVPFKVKKDATGSDIQTSIDNYLVTDKKLDPLSAEYSSEFGKLWLKIKQSS